MANKINDILSKKTAIQLRALAESLNIKHTGLTKSKIIEKLVESPNKKALKKALGLSFRWKSQYNFFFAVFAFVFGLIFRYGGCNSQPNLSSCNFKEADKFNVVVLPFRKMSDNGTVQTSKTLFYRLKQLVASEELESNVVYCDIDIDVTTIEKSELEMIMEDQNIDMLIYGARDINNDSSEISLNWLSISELKQDESFYEIGLNNDFTYYTNNQLKSGFLQESIDFSILFFTALVSYEQENYLRVIELIDNNIHKNLNRTSCLSNILLFKSYLQLSLFNAASERLNLAEELCSSDFDWVSILTSSCQLAFYSENYSKLDNTSAKFLKDQMDNDESFANVYEIIKYKFWANHKRSLYTTNKVFIDSIMIEFSEEVKTKSDFVRMEAITLSNNGYPLLALELLKNSIINESNENRLQSFIDDFLLIAEKFGLDLKAKEIKDAYPTINRHSINIGKDTSILNNFLQISKFTYELFQRKISKENTPYDSIRPHWISFCESVNERAGNLPLSIGLIESGLGVLAAKESKFEEANIHFEEAIMQFNKVPHKNVLIANVYYEKALMTLSSRKSLQDFKVGGFLFISQEVLESEKGMNLIFDGYINTQDSIEISRMLNKVDSLLTLPEPESLELKILQLDAFAYLHQKLGNTQNSITFYRQILQIIKNNQLNETKYLGQYLFNVGTLLLDNNEKEGLRFLEMAYNFKKQIHGERSLKLIPTIKKMLNSESISDKKRIELEDKLSIIEKRR